LANNTPRLNLYKKDPVADANDTFNIQTMLNDNWDRIDANVVLVSEKGAPNGVATLGPDGKVPASQLNVSTTASAITIADSGGYYTGADVESALQEIGQAFNAVRGDLITTVNTILNDQ
jgi:phage-related minor tail protein